MNITDINRTRHPQKQSTHYFPVYIKHFQNGTHARSKNKFHNVKKIEIISTVLSDHDGLKSESQSKIQ